MIIGKLHVRGIGCQLDADFLRLDLERIQISSIHIVLYRVIIGVYGYCYYNDSTPGLDGKHNHKFDNQQSRLHRTVAQALNYTLPKVFDGPRCSYFKGMYNYFTIHSN
jgi:hypothetical protein